jgi:hypothetical protein
MDERLTLKTESSVRIKGAGLLIHLDAVGHGWYADGSGEFAYIDLTTELGGDEKSINIEVDETAGEEGYAIQFISAEPFVETSCDLAVTER